MNMLRRFSRLLLLILALTALLIAAMPTMAQGGTGEPPPGGEACAPLPDVFLEPGTVVIPPLIVVVPPDGIDPLENEGEIIQVPVDPTGTEPDEDYEYLDADFGIPPFDTCDRTFYFPLLPDARYNRFEIVTQAELDDIDTWADDLPPEVVGKEYAPFTLQSFTDVPTPLTDYSLNPILAVFKVPDPDNPPLLYTFDEVTGEYTLLYPHLPPPPGGVVPTPTPNPPDPPDPQDGLYFVDGEWVIVYEIVDTSNMFVLFYDS